MPTIDDDVVIDNLNQVVYSLAEDDMQECIRLFLNLYIDIDSELSLGAKLPRKNEYTNRRYSNVPRRVDSW